MKKNFIICSTIVMMCFSLLILKCSAQADSAALYATGNSAIVMVVPSVNMHVPRSISRCVGDSTGKFQQVATIKKVTTLSEFRKITGDDYTDSLQKYLKLNDDNALWNYIEAHDTLRGYGYMAFSIDFLKAMGDMYVDESLKKLQAGTKVYYRIQQGNNTSLLLNYTIPSLIEQRPTVLRTTQQDSAVSITWATPFATNRLTLTGTANVYRQNSKGGFDLLPVKIPAYRIHDSLRYIFTDRNVVPGRWYKYFIAPVDALNKPWGINSDTVRVLSADNANLPTLNNVNATDTGAGILLAWGKIKSSLYVTGIQIERSNVVTGPFVIIATVDRKDTSFLDDKCAFGKPCYYRLAVVGDVNSKKPSSLTYSGFASSSHVDKTDIPNAPYNMHIKDVTNSLTIGWRPVQHNALAGYYVYRGTKADTSSLQLISRLQTDTMFTDTTKNGSHRLDYYYAVKAVGISGARSRFSQVVQGKLTAGLDVPVTPAWVHIARQNNGLYIEWNDTKRNDPYIKGYLVYRRKLNSAALERISQDTVTRAYCIDSIHAQDTGYVYAVASIDIGNTTSAISSAGVVPPVNNALDAPLRLMVRSLGNAIELTWAQVDTTNVTGYNIYRKEQGQKGFEKIASINLGSRVYVDTTVESAKLYLYKIKAFNTGGESVGYAANSMRVN